MMTVLPIKQIRTNNPEKETWRYLQLFSKESYITKLVASETAKNQITSCIRQATEIYTLSQSASILTKPILLYYGMQRLAKALIFLRNPEANPKDLRSHGLSGRGIYDKSEKFLHNQLPKTKTGIFPEFSNWTTKNNILLKKTVYEKADYHFTQHWVYECNIPDFINASSFRVYELFSLIPELIDLFHYFKMENELLIYCGLSIRQHPTGEVDSLLSVDKKLALDSLRRKFPAIEEYALLKEKPDRFTLSREREKEIKLPSPLVQSESRDLFLIATTNDSEKLPDMNVHYILMFLLCHIARYKAPLWKEIMEGTKRSEHIALIEKFIEVSERKFPKLILDQLIGQYLVYM